MYYTVQVKERYCNQLYEKKETGYCNYLNIKKIEVIEIFKF